MIAACKFTGVINGKPKQFKPGDTITKSEALEMDIKSKPHLVEAVNAKAK